jgi:ribosomal protein S18 acetylase RimI-like enzyme
VEIGGVEIGGVEIVRAAEVDWPLVRAVRLRALAADPSAFGSTVQREAALSEQDWRDRIRGAAWFLAMPGPAEPVEPAADPADPAGVALVRPLEPGSDADFEINAMWVAPELRGQRIGKALLDAVLAAAGSSGARTVRLWVTNGNDGALALYTRRGFLPTGRTEPLLSDPQLVVAEYVLALG